MNRAFRRVSWLALLAPFFACNRAGDDDDSLVRQITRVRVSPDDFLGDLSCGLEGGMQSYQATLIDVTEGLDEAFVLPSSSVVSCESDVNFEFVQPGHRYIAQVSGFEQTGLRSQNPGSPVVIGADGLSVSPRWFTTCWGDDRVDPPEFGGAGGEASADLGAEAYNRTIVFVRGCEALEVEGVSRVSVDLTQALFGLSCGERDGQVERFSVYSEDDSDPQDDPAQGGAGGATDPGPEAPLADASCGQPAILENMPPGLHLTFSVLAYGSGETGPTWQTTCTALTRPGVTVPARCNPLLPL